MINIFKTAESGMSAYQEELDHLSNDLVNMNTTGYKKTDVGFKELLMEKLDRRGTPLVDKTAVNGTGVKTGYTYKIRTQGNLISTGVSTDVALDDDGQGLFAVTLRDGSIAYTRDGNFKVDSTGVLVDSIGSRVYIEYEPGASEGEPKLSSKDMTISEDGEISLKQGEDEVKIGKIPVFTAIGDRAFYSIGNSYMKPQDPTEVTLSTDYSMQQGMLENSNVDTTETMTDVVSTSRAFQMSSKALEVADELWGMINNMR
ncbi:flagellar hook-basal body complex protein [Clostridium sp. BJN0001]|uniref:flagellar hook-basal body complex protein n=1 Tax=Clostridium sp. BJN0001 TaxID=2930219 RepID=UPI001FD5F587|nr:flagellar hook-basal body complex protein [Clostridium sp. BJN0001]